MFYFNNLVRDVKNAFSDFLLNNICKNNPRVVTKFIFDMTWGIMTFGSSKISNISRALYEANIRITENRLTKKLKEMDLSCVEKNFNQYAFKHLIRLNPIIIVGESDVIKPHGNAFEGLNYIKESPMTSPIHFE